MGVQTIDERLRPGEAELRLARVPRRLEAHDQAHGEHYRRTRTRHTYAGCGSVALYLHG